MPTFRISVVDQAFRASNDHELASFDEARKHGIKAALAIGAGEVANGEPYFGVEVLVEDGDETLGRFVVSVGASSLQYGGASKALVDGSNPK